MLKRLAEGVLAATVGSGRVVRRMRGRVLVLAYHNVLPPGAAPAGDRSLHLPWEAFTAQLDLLARQMQVVPLSRLLEDGAVLPARPRVVITFDDAYAGAVTHALPELASRGMPATVFVAPAMLDGAAFWWDRIADPSLGAVRSGLRARALDEFAGRDEAVMTWAAREGLPLAEPAVHARGAALEALDRAVALPGITIGAHTWSHPNVVRIPTAEIHSELSRSLSWLDRFGARAVRALAYPYGLWSEDAERVARAAGYQLTLRVDGGWTPIGAPVTRPLPRMNVSAGLSAQGFQLRLAGFLAR